MIMSTLHHITPSDRHGEALTLRSMTTFASTAMPLLFGAGGAAIGASALFWVMGRRSGGEPAGAQAVAAGGRPQVSQRAIERSEPDPTAMPADGHGRRSQLPPARRAG